MKPRFLLAAAVLLFLSTGASQAAGFVNLAFNDNAFDVWAGFRVGGDDDGGVMLGGRYLYNDDEDATVPAFLLSFASKPDANQEIDFNLGLQTYFGEAHDQDVQGVAIGGFAIWAPGKMKGVYFGGRIFYGPSVFCFGDTDGTFEWGAQAGYAFNPKMRVYVEWSDFEADIENGGTVAVDDGVKFGFGARF
jgi:hypothetical protein